MKRFDVGASRGMRRLRLGLTAALLSLLAIAALAFTLGLVEDPAMRYRVDLSEVGRNTLDPATEDLLARLDEPVIAHTFFRRDTSPLDIAREDARTRMLDLFLIASKLAPDRFRMQQHNMNAIADVQAEFQRLGLSSEQLRSNAVNLVVLEQADRHVALRLEPDIAELGPNPLDSTKAAVLRFRGEEALADSLLKVAADNRPRVFFSTGHGEASIEDEGPIGLTSLARTLAGDGFDIGVWNASQNGPLPDEATILAVMAPTDPFGPDELRLIEEFRNRGGRVLVLENERFFGGSGSLQNFLSSYGILSVPGLVCVPTLSQDLGEVTTGIPACAQYLIELAGLNSSHPITKPLWSASRKVPVARSLAFERGIVPSKGTMQELLIQRDRNAWKDLPDANGRFDYVWNFQVEETGPFALAMASEVPMGETTSRAVAIGSGLMAANQLFGESNRDFMLNVFNWLAERDFNVRIGFQQDKRRQIDVIRGTEVIWMRRIAWYGLPGLLLAMGLFLAWRRRA